MSEDCRDVPGWEHRYEITRDGVVYCKEHDKTIRSPYGKAKRVHVPRRVATPWIDATGRPRINLYDDGKRTTMYVHEMLAQTYGVEING